MVKLGLCSFKHNHHNNPRPRWSVLQWLTEDQVVKKLKLLDALAQEKDCMRLLLQIFDEQTAEEIVTST